MGNLISCLFCANARRSVETHPILDARVRQGSQGCMITPNQEHESGIYRPTETKDTPLAALHAEYYGGTHKSYVALMKEKVEAFGDRRAMAWRDVLRVESTEKIDADGKRKPWEITHLGPPQFLSFRQMWSLMGAFGAGLMEAGFEAGDYIGLYAETCKEWMISCYALWSQGMVGVTVYANLGEEALACAIKESALKGLICTAKGAAMILRMCQANDIALPRLILLDDPKPEDPPLEAAKGVVVKWYDLVALGRTAAAAGRHPIVCPQDPDAMALIMYTSGTTGNPKGVMLTHGNVYACVLGFYPRLSTYFYGCNLDDLSYVAYLPLAHILEFGVENLMLSHGVLVCYGSPRTLTSNTAQPTGDFEEFKPVVIVGVPRVFEAIKKNVEEKLPASGIKRAIFDSAYIDRLEHYAKGQVIPAYDAKVFAATRAIVGGRLRAIVCGGAPINYSTVEFLTVIFGCSVQQGYGLTESCSHATLTHFWDLKDSIGALLATIEVKLVDIDEWKHTDPLPRGEIYLRGPTIGKGYYKQPEMTREAFTEDGWFKTGDIGEFQPNGTMKIVGRVKALAKNLYGEYIALERLESIYVQNELAVPNGVCVLVDPYKGFITALVCTEEKKALKFAKAHDIPGAWPDVLKDSFFQLKATESMAKTAVDNLRKPFEVVKRVKVIADEWSPENGLLTAATKLKRGVIEERYKDIIAALFSENTRGYTPRSQKHN